MNNIYRKFTWRFIGYFIMLYVLINIALFSLIIFSSYLFEDKLFSSDPSFESTYNMQDLIDVSGKKPTISPILMDSLKKSDHVLLIRNEQDEIVKVFNKQDEIHPLSWYYLRDIRIWSLTPDYDAVLINRSPLVRTIEYFDLGQKDKVKEIVQKYHLAVFKQDIHSDKLTKIYGDFSTAEVENNWFKDLNGDNFNKYQFHESSVNGSYYLFVAENKYVRDKRIIFDENGLFLDEEFTKSAKVFFYWYAGFSTFILLLILTLALLFGRRMTRPLIHFIKWTERLSKGDYVIPNDDKIYKKSKMRRKYQLYSPIDESMRDLTHQLKENEAYQKQIATLRDEWIAGISHDIKTPLSSIYGYSKLLNSELELNCTDRKKFAEIIEQKASYIDDLLKDLNMTYQMKNKGLDVSKQSVNLKDYLTDFVNHYNNDKLSLIYANDVILLIDIERMNRVLMNIVGNAFKHNEGSDVWITTSLFEKQVIIEIADNGQGIPQEDMNKIFQHYYQGKNSSGGSGLGLAVSKQIVESHNGYIQVQSSVAGSKFMIYLPVTND